MKDRSPVNDGDMDNPVKRRGLCHSLVLLGALLAVLMFGACGARKVNQILSDPTKFANKDVKVEGTVTESYSVLGKGAYQVADGTGRIWVVSTKGVPRKGARVSVKGRVKEAFDLGGLVTLPKGLDSGLVLVESSHKARD
jgi:hypothetical protein